MAGELNFTSREEFKNWLKYQPIDWARAIALRAALRVLPLAADVLRDSIPGDRQIHLIFCVFRVNFISSGAYGENASDNIAPDDIRRSYAAAYAAAAATANDAYDAAAATYAAAAANDAAVAAYAYAAAAYAYDAYAACDTDDGGWQSVRADAQWLADGHGDGGDLRRQKLWLTADGAHARVAKYWRKLKASPLVMGAGFAPWLAWYEALVPLGRRKKPAAYFSPDLARRIARQPNKWWKRGAAACNADIAAWIEAEKAKPSSEKAAPAETLKETIRLAVANTPQPEPAADGFVWKDDKIEAAPPNAKPNDDAGAEDLMGEVRRKGDALLACCGNQRRIQDSLRLLLGALPADRAQFRPLLFRSRLRSVESDARIFAGPAGMDELTPETLSALVDVATTARDLLACYPVAVQADAAAMALGVNDMSAAETDQLAQQLDATTAAAVDATEVVSEGAAQVLVRMAEGAAAEPEAAVRARRLADRALVVWNFVVTLARGATAIAIDGAVAATGFGKEIWDKARAKIIEGVADEMAVGARMAAKWGLRGGIGYLAAEILAGFGDVGALTAKFEKARVLLDIVQKLAP